MRFSVTADPGSQTITVSDGQSLGADRFSTPYPISDGSWHLLDVSFDGGTVSAYLDGQAIGTAPLGGLTTITSGQPLTASGPQGLDEVAIYPAAVNAVHLTGRWTQGGAGAPACTPVPSSRYPLAALGDSPVAYYRLGELSGSLSARVAFDSSGRCGDGAYTPNAVPVAGALAGDSDTAIQGGFTASAGSLPSGAAARTVEAWFTVASQPVSISYGRVSTGDAFSVTADPGSQTITVSDGQSLGADRFSTPYPISDGSWHLLDVSFDGSTVSAYLDGQAIGTAPLGGLTTITSGQPLTASGSQGLDESPSTPPPLTPGTSACTSCADRIPRRPWSGAR